MIGWLFRFLIGRRLKWFAAGAVVRFLARRTASSRVEGKVEQATRDIEERLPAPVARALDAVPVDLTRTAGSAVVAGQAARRAAETSRRVGYVSVEGGRRVTRAADRVRSIPSRFRGDLRDETERRRRDLQDRYLRSTEGAGAADEAWLDVRTAADVFPADHAIDGRPVAGGTTGRLGGEEEPLPTLVEPARSGRWRADRRLPRPLVGRVQRTYRQAPKPWDR